MGFFGWKLADKSWMNNLPVPQLPVLLLRALTRTGGAAAAFPEDRGSEVAAGRQIAVYCSACMYHSERPLEGVIHVQS